MSSTRTPVGIVGATGLVGQHLAAALATHPWFELAWVAASERSAGRRFGDLPWRPEGTCPDHAARLRLETPRPGAGPALLFSALDAASAHRIEPALAEAGHTVVSNASAYRLRDDVPLVVPEINAPHLAIAKRQRWQGRLITNPNCSTIFIALALAPLAPFGIEAVTVSTLQAISGAGHPGVAALDVLGNVIPWIDGEEEKIERETLKILDDSFPIAAQTTRVPVPHGHLALVSVRLNGRVEEADLTQAWQTFRGPRDVQALPSAPATPVQVVSGCDRPQPRLDLGWAQGMGVSIGRLRRCPVLGWRFVVLGHNLVRGAAGAALLNAELAVISSSACR